MFKKACVVIIVFVLLFNTIVVHGYTLSKSGSLNAQIESLFTEVSGYCGLNEVYVRELYSLAGGNAIYIDKNPNIYLDETIHSAKAPMEMSGAKIVYKEIPSPRAEGVSRTMAYYLPDALYSVSYDISQLMKERLSCNRGDYQVYFNSFIPEIRERIAFYEAVLIYTGVSPRSVNKFQLAYEKTLTSKESSENVVLISDDGRCEIKPKFIGAFQDAGITSYSSLKYLAEMFSYDSYLAENDDIESLRSAFILPYEPNYTSMENMMVAAACLVGRVRYVWGGGHSGASYIDGINPVWEKFDAMYEENDNACIKPSGSWCPVHGYTSSEYHGGIVSSLDDYVNHSAEVLNADELLADKYRQMFSQVDYSNGINIHTLDGLDCSGFTSWLYNQVTDKFNVNSTAANFTKQSGIVPLEFGSDLNPGDMFAWTSHIVVIVGKVSEGSKAYVTVEATPPVLRYGVVYYSGASQSDIGTAMQIAKEANQLIGGIYNEPHVYCMNSQGYYTVAGESTQVFYKYHDAVYEYDEENDEDILVQDSYYEPMDEEPESYVSKSEEWVDGGKLVTFVIREEETNQYVEVGRLGVEFSDMEFANLTARDVIQRVLTRLSINYVVGYNDYRGELFNKERVATNLGFVVEEVEDVEEVLGSSEE